MTDSLTALRIDDLDADDAAEVMHLLRSVAAGGTLGRDPDEYDLGEVQASLTRAAVERLAVGMRDGDALVGVMLGSRMIPRRFRHVLTGLSIAVDASRQGRGLGRLLFEAFLARADQLEPTIDRVELMLQAGNPGAQRLYASLGFEVEGTLRARVSDAVGRRVDDIMMARLRPTGAPLSTSRRAPS